MNRANKLFHGLVVMGASMTGAIAACGGATTQTNSAATPDAAVDPAASELAVDAGMDSAIEAGQDDDHTMEAAAPDVYGTISPCPNGQANPLCIPPPGDAASDDAIDERPYATIAPPPPPAPQ